jgi:hypothetical protein
MRVMHDSMANIRHFDAAEVEAAKKWLAEA